MNTDRALCGKHTMHTALLKPYCQYGPMASEFQPLVITFLQCLQISFALSAWCFVALLSLWRISAPITRVDSNKERVETGGG